MHGTLAGSTRAAALAFGVALFAGCGGGDDEPAVVTPSPPLFDVQVSLEQLFQREGEFELTGTDPLGNAMRQTYRFSPAAVPADPRLAGAWATRVEAWSAAWPDSKSETTYYYLVNPFRLLARGLGSSGTMYYTQTAEIPSVAAAGSAAEFAQGQQPQSPQLERASWQVREAGAAGTAWVCLETAQIRSGAFLCTLAGPSGTALRRRAGGWSIGFSYDLQSPP